MHALDIGTIISAIVVGVQIGFTAGACIAIRWVKED